MSYRGCELAFVFNFFKVADGSEVATIEGAAVNFLSEDGSTTSPFLESNSQNASRATKLKLNERIPGTDDGIIIQAVVDESETKRVVPAQHNAQAGSGSHPPNNVKFTNRLFFNQLLKVVCDLCQIKRPT